MSISKLPVLGQQQRIEKLDSVRGIAALIVVIGHCGGFSFWGLLERPWLRWLSILWDGESAVIMFFLLSGYVLALQLGGASQPSYRQYLIRRIMRIWPAFSSVTALSWIAFNWAALPVDAGPLHDRPQIPDFHDLVANLFMYQRDYAIVPPVWSLFVEMRISIVFPLLYFLVRNTGPFWSALLSAIISVGLSRLVHWPLNPFLLSLAESSRFIVVFTVGAILAQRGRQVEKNFASSGASVKLAAFVLALCCLFYRFIVIKGDMLPGGGYVRWCGVALLFGFCLYSTVAESILNHHLLIFLGRVSYGVYLSHFTVMLFVRQVASGSLLTLLVVLTSIGLGWAINKYVEQPMITLGRRLSAQLKMECEKAPN